MPVIFEIDFKGQNGLFELTREYTAFPGEDEILIQDGLKYTVKSNEIVTLSDKQACHIKLAYPAEK